MSCKNCENLIEEDEHVCVVNNCVVCQNCFLFEKDICVGDL